MTRGINVMNETAKRVLQIEGNALLSLANELPRDFSTAVAAISTCKGRVIVSGVGKSGHVGRKISATLASTGTASYFVHATEASHGDLGMISNDDICLLISNSGETAELRDITAHALRFSIPIIAISSKADSTLMKAASYRLTLPNAPEACSIGMAPTTSTTLTLAIGDALAVVLMEQCNFRPEHFHVFHPGGKLGAQIATVGQLMHSGDELPVVEYNVPMQEALISMTSKGFGIAAVVKDHTLWGVISDGDLRRHIHHLMDRTAGEIASQRPLIAKVDEFAAETLLLMNVEKISALIVVDDKNIPCGILHIHDLLRAGVS